jgi:hypothetical protein
MVFSKRGEASKVEPCVQNNAWPTDCKFIFFTTKFLQVDPISVSCHVFDQQEAFENSPGSLFVFACEPFMMHICGACILKKQTF